MKKEKDLYQVSLKVFIKNKKGEVLVMGADPLGSYAGFYDFPGGRIDKDEFATPFSEIIKREVHEEIGNDVAYRLNPKPVAVGRHIIPAHLSKTGKDIHVMYVFFEAEYLGGDVRVSDEHQGFEWLDLGKIQLEKYFKSGNLEGVKMYIQNNR